MITTESEFAIMAIVIVGFTAFFVGLFSHNTLVFVASGLGLVILSIVEWKASYDHQARLSEDAEW